MKFALIGHPVAHSLSPAIHRAAYRELGSSHEYSLIDAATEADVDRVVASLRSGELGGLNVTIPWKRHAFAAADRKSALSERLGVANVLAREGAEIVAHNTDALALEVEFRRLLSAPTARAVVLGSGGATPAVVAACSAAGIADVCVTARRFEPKTPESDWPGARELRRLGARLSPWPGSSKVAKTRFEELCRGAGLVVQCTSAGMQGTDSGEPLAALVPWPKLAADALAYDLIYAPLETPFLRVAREAGHRTAHGLHMLVGQAALAIEIWLGQRPPTEPLLAAALEELGKRGARLKKHPPWLGSRDGAWPSVEVNGAIERAEAEWLHTNGAGAYSMSTIAMMHTRRHHGALVVALPPPLGRHVIVSHADLTLTIENDRRPYRLATHQFPDVAPTPGYRNLLSFAQDPIPRWVFRAGSGTLERTLCLVRGENAVIMGYTWSGSGPARISLRPLMPLRPVASLMHEHGGMEQLVALRPGAVELRPVERLPAIYFAHDGMFMGGPDWWRRFEYLADRGEHAEFQEDMWTPGVFELPLEPGRTSYLVTSVGKLLNRPPGELVMEACEAISREALGVGRPAAVRLLSVAAEQFCLDAATPPMVIAGYPWHAPYTRDFLLALPGLTLARGRVDLAVRALPTLLASQRGGFLPEFLTHSAEPRPKPLPDATLWLYEVARLLLPELGAEHAKLKRQLYNALVRSFARLRSNLKRWGWLSADGLLVNGAEGVALTWMDAHVGAVPVTPRRGIAIEQQALFTQATGTLATLADEAGNRQLAEACRAAGVKAHAAFRARFWCHDTDFPYDCVSESRDTQDAWVDASIRPNALIALAVDPSLFDDWQARAVVARVRAELLTPRGIRSLSPLDARYVSQFAGTLEEKETAYHQGTAWTHLLGFYVRAAIRLAPDDEELREELRHVVEGALDGSVILGQIAQLADGDMPHRARGCPAQATSVAELIRALVVDLGV